MFGVEILDVAIGMIFVFLMLSLVCSAVNEIIESWLSKRADYLEQGIKELLDKPANIDSQIVKEIYDHPLINGLFQGRYSTRDKNFWYYIPGWIREMFGGKKKTFLPTYIPAENFSTALIDIFLNTVHDENITNITSPPVIGSPPLRGVTTSPPSTSFSVEALRGVVENNIGHDQLGKAAKALRALMEMTGDDADKLKKGIEAWFN